MHCVSLSRRDHVVIWLILLQHQPHRFDIFLRIAPVTLGVKVAQIKILLQACLDTSSSASNLAGDKGLAASGRFMVEQYSVAGKHPVALSVIDRCPMGINLSNGIWAAGIKGGGLFLWRL